MKLEVSWVSSVGEREKEKGDIRPRTREVGGSKITHVIHAAAPRGHGCTQATKENAKVS